jgi:SAM-dependent methyltransferase
LTSWLVDPEAIAEEYASEAALRERVLAFRELLVGTNDEEVVRERIVAAQPRRLIDVGSGLGDLGAWAKAFLNAEVVAVDSSPRMVELAAEAGVTAVLADMRQLPFGEASFDCAAACMALYHVRDPETAIAELARVLDAGGLLLASTGSDDDLERRLAWARLFNEEPQPASPPLSFSRENGRNLLLTHFRRVQQIDCDAALVFPTRERLARYVQALPLASEMAGSVPELREPFRLPVKATVFEASTPR